ncbi:winged helix-turn-helix domain-containing protein [Dokdonella koreensis]|uniref:Transcriptional regulator n=1 Tax=Dokdonella koreensis DS-123 TaxID=1300342 RepID=A0A160DS25_9GAMM|nr:winged helix-turn-helix domain-containing protein [Dokdonella koreensis]ANB16844.1 Putative transcriptional regulator [Dokdonella koreensis DS-123]
MSPRERPRYRPRYRFGAFAVDPATREMRRDGTVLTVSPKVFDCIVHLIANRDRAVGHGELGATVWSRADVTDTQIRQLMRKVRRILDDDGEQQAVIRTIAHFGFHWVAPTIEEDAAQAARESEPLAAALSPPPRNTARVRRWLVRAALALAAGTVTLGSVLWHRDRDQSAQGPAFARAAGATGVLPTEVTSPGDSADSTWMRLGLMDFVVGRLRQAAVPVIPSSDIVALSRDGGDAGELAARVRGATGATAIVATSAMRQSNGWMVRLVLHDAQGSERVARAYSPDALLAAQAAADQLIAYFGKNPPLSVGDAPPPSTAQLLQRIEAALLADDFAGAQTLIEGAPAAVRELPEIQLQLARIDNANDRDAATRERLTKLLTTVSAEDDPVLRARALNLMGFLDTVDVEASVRSYDEAIDLLDPLDNPVYLGSAHLGRAITYAIADRSALARADYERARVLFTMANDSLQLARVDNAEAGLDAASHRAAEALPLLERSIRTVERFGATERLITPVINQIQVHLQLLQAAPALALYERMRPKLAGATSKESLNYLDFTGALGLIANGRLTEARTLLAAVASAADPVEEAGLRAMIEGQLAQLALVQGRFDVAAEQSARALDALAGVRGFSTTRVDLALTRLRALRGAGRRAEAEAETADLTRRLGAQTVHETVLRVHLAEAEQCWADGQHERAIAIYDTATATAEREGTPYHIRMVAESYAGALLDAGDPARASLVTARLGRWGAEDFDVALMQVRLYHALGQPEAWRTALGTARALAGERPIPLAVQVPPVAGSGLVQQP